MADADQLAILTESVLAWNNWRTANPALQGDLSGAILDGRNLAGADFTGVDLSYVSARNCVLASVTCDGADLTGADLSGSAIDLASFDEATIRLARLREVTSELASFVAADLREADCTGAHITAKFVRADLSNAILAGSDLTGSDFSEANLAGADMRDANLTACDLQGVNLASTTLDRANLAGATLYRLTPPDLDLSTSMNVPTEPPRFHALASAPGRGGSNYFVDPPDDESTARVVNVFFATDRERLVPFGPRRYYGSRDSHALEFGVCEVSVPFQRPIGTVPRPRWWRLEFRQNLATHVVLLGAAPHDRESWVSTLRQSISPDSERAAFVFVHGFNVSFEDAARKAAQLACDLKFLGVPLLYSWPSKSSIKHYTADSTSAERTAIPLAEFLQVAVRDGKIDNLHLIAHSLGGRACTFALEAVANFAKGRLLDQVVFAAPDVDVSVFIQRHKQIVASGDRVTVYCSASDVALAISGRVNQANRLGSRPIVLEGIDTIDATELEAPDILGHSFGRSVVADIFELLTKRTPPSQRFGVVRKTGAGYYELRPSSR